MFIPMWVITLVMTFIGVVAIIAAVDEGNAAIGFWAIIFMIALAIM